MLHYILKRLLLILPTLLGVLTITFLIIQLVPGGPVEQMIAEIQGTHAGTAQRVSGAGMTDRMGGSDQISSQRYGEDPVYRGAQGLDPELIAELEQQFGFDKPVWERYWIMLSDYAQFDMGESFFRSASVLDLVLEKMPVSISLGLWTTLLAYLISIPLGIRKAVSDGSRFDVNTSIAIVIGYAIPAFLFAILLIVLFAGGSFMKIFPLRGLVSEGWGDMPWYQQILDYLWHMVLPVTAMTIGGFAQLTMLTKNCFLEEISKQYVLTARAKGCSEKQVLYGHVFRNAMLIVVAGFPAAFIAVFFGSSMVIEIIFSLDGLGLLGYESMMKRDYPVVMGTLYVMLLIGLVLHLITDLVYVLIDPRIDFERRAA